MALEAYSFGKVQAALGEVDEAERLLKKAWEVYSVLGIQWRAARAAQALAMISDESDWREKARECLRSYPRCWLSRGTAAELATRAGSYPELERLTPARRAVFDLLMEGCSTADIAKRLGRSTFTVRNHIKVIFKVFGATSRSALVVRASARLRDQEA
jgi:DNA-binding NarL/FixJ family response regulator